MGSPSVGWPSSPRETTEGKPPLVGSRPLFLSSVSAGRASLEVMGLLGGHEVLVPPLRPPLEVRRSDGLLQMCAIAANDVKGVVRVREFVVRRVQCEEDL